MIVTRFGVAICPASWKMQGHKLCNLVTFSRSRATLAWRMQMLLLASIQRRVSILELQMGVIEKEKCNIILRRDH